MRKIAVAAIGAGMLLSITGAAVVYRRGLDGDKALGEIQRGRGASFDPDVADAFLEVAPRSAA